MELSFLVSYKEFAELFFIVMGLLFVAETRKEKNGIWKAVGYGLSVVMFLLVFVATWADEILFSPFEGYIGPIIGIVICGFILYHSDKDHADTSNITFVAVFTLVLFEGFEIGLQTISQTQSDRVWGMIAGAGLLLLTIAVYKFVMWIMDRLKNTSAGKSKSMPFKQVGQLQRVATVALALSAWYLIINSFEVLQEKDMIWFGYAALVIAIILAVAGLIQTVLKNEELARQREAKAKALLST